MNWVVGSTQRAECQACGLFRLAQRPFIPPVIEDAQSAVDLALVGEAPGHREEERGEYFVGPAGRLLDDMIDASVPTVNVAFFNAVQCWPGTAAEGGDAKPTMTQVRCCRELLLDNLAAAQPRVVLGVGQWGGRALTDNGTLTIGGKKPSRGRRLSIPDLGGFDVPEFVSVTYHPSAVLHRQPWLRDLIEADLAAALSTKRQILPKFQPITPGKLKDLARLGPLSFDAEYNGTPGTDEIFSFSVYDGTTLYAAAVDRQEAYHSREVWREAFQVLVDECPEFRGHNVAADLLALFRFGVRPPEFLRVNDSLTWARAVWENDPDRTLETVAVTHLGLEDYAEEIKPWKAKNPSDFGSTAPLDVLLAYNAGDSYASWELLNTLTDAIPWTLMSLMMESVYSLTLATWDGQHIDKRELTKVKAKYTREVNATLSTLRKLTGLKTFNPRDAGGKAWPFKVLKWKPLSMGKEGPNLDEHCLKHYERFGKPKDVAFAVALLAYRKAVNRNDRLQKDFTARRDASGRVHAWFNVPGTRTLRDSSKAPNFQNITPELRRMFTSRWR